MTELFTNINPIDSKNNQESYRFTIIKFDTNQVDLSVFTPNEWEQIETINMFFKQRQSWEADESDELYSWSMSKENPNQSNVIAYREKIHWFDNELKKIFGSKFENIDCDCGDENEIQSGIRILSKANVVEINKLRKWFCKNFNQLDQYYQELK
jgi:hypothetical protein